MSPGPSPGPASSIQDAQRNRVVVDAVVQAGLSARIAFSLVAGLAGQADSHPDDEVKEIAQRAQQAAEGVKNADMSLDMALAEGPVEAASALRDGAAALERAAEAFEVAAEAHERIDELKAANGEG